MAAGPVDQGPGGQTHMHTHTHLRSRPGRRACAAWAAPRRCRPRPPRPPPPAAPPRALLPWLLSVCGVEGVLRLGWFGSIKQHHHHRSILPFFQHRLHGRSHGPLPCFGFRSNPTYSRRRRFNDGHEGRRLSPPLPPARALSRPATKGYLESSAAVGDRCPLSVVRCHSVS